MLMRNRTHAIKRFQLELPHRKRYR